MDQPEIRECAGKLLVGVRRRISFVNDRTSEIWREFRAREKTIEGRRGHESYSVKVYDAGYSFANLDPSAEFEKWAAAEASESCEGFDMLEIPEGKYAVFIHKGPASAAALTFGYVFGEWLPNSVFELDHRPHFEVLPAGYDPFSPDGEEEVWIPVREKA
jgi:AraC family transcriptional regulator